MLDLAIRSLRGRYFTVALTVIAVALSVALLLGVERLREAARNGFTDTVAGLDLIIAARGDDLQILLATVFGIGSTSNPVSWETYEDFAARSEVAWAVPVALGDTHEGFPVIGTTSEYFERIGSGDDRSLRFADGRQLEAETDAVIGAEVAQALGYTVGTIIVNAHGAGEIEIEVHDETPFVVVGVLERTGRPIDRMVFVSLEGFAAIHETLVPQPVDPLAPSDNAKDARMMFKTGEHDLSGNDSGTDSAAKAGHDREDAREHHHEDDGDHLHEDEGDRHHKDQGDHHNEKAFGDLNAIFVGLVAPEAALSAQRAIAEYEEEPLTAVLPAATLFRLWSITSVAESALRAVALAVLVAGLLGLVVMFTATLEARRREFAILRSVGARPMVVAGLVLIESVSVALIGIVLGLVLLGASALVAGGYLINTFGFTLPIVPTSGREGAILGGIAAAALLASLIPAWRGFRQTIADGLNIRL